ncbi:DUF5686 and carboxypeptidase regulatory-like domain-containing protein [Flavobacterium sp. SM15]|uniref:DUF5686 and carboxypeptidase regulatory-like domain-containing protein n=1 Tax=Flavobacterium sp. SM15 TaxID=2908005 RepID=UPI001EDBBA79|nr:DUF5686 and carboxypeptidase regulatory-like domain-containing protein [Flavobacterium sp. SM15]MCG2610530.1 DUF5686 and carboxypeptidase regulatory-like domain-containing protein [Flavobacterium sp. SM15]
MKKLFFLTALLFISNVFAQIKGKITDKNGNPIPYTTVMIQGTYNGTSANDDGLYELVVKEKGNYTLQFQSLGYKTKKVTQDISQFPYTINVTLEDENYTLSEMVITPSKEDPAYAIIRSAIKNRKKNSDKTDKYEADFYSRGIFRAKNVPKKFMGVEIGDFDGSLDSTGTGILYLSETVSKIAYEKPDKIKEEIIASKVSGDDNGFSFNTARGTNYDFYSNYVEMGINMISPIADNALSYYKYTLESTFVDDHNQLINKIKVKPRRDKEPVFEGYLYIVEDTWAIYAIDLDSKGYRMQQPILENIKFTQNYNYNPQTKIWAKNQQTIDFKAGMFGMGFTGKFTHVFSNYVFRDKFEKKVFTNEVAKIVKDANKKDDGFWNESRPVPLTDEEIGDYHKKDSIQTIRKSQVYLDSIDAKGNKFKLQKLITGYTYRDTYNKWSASYKGVLDVTSLGFNTVQGWNLDSGFSFSKRDEEKGKYTFINSVFNYGFAEDRLRINGSITHRFNNINYALITLSGGSSINQFNPSNPISNLVNSVSTLFFKDNYAKYYNKEFAKIAYSQNVLNGIGLTGSLEYSARKPLFNNTDYVLIKNDKDYTSNNPLLPYNNSVAAFEKHNLMKATIGTRISFGNKYITRPDGRINIANDDYPKLSFNYEKGFAGNKDSYNYDFVSGLIDYDKTLGNKGDFAIRLKGGKFFNAENISFIDYKHFNGNQTHIGMANKYLNVFNLLPYYTNSTNDAYFETHMEHNDKGFIMNKIPLLNKLQWNLVVGFHQLNVPNYKPYQEFSVGFDNFGLGKFRLMRIDYVRSYQSGFQTDGIVFGLKFLNILN